MTTKEFAAIIFARAKHRPELLHMHLGDAYFEERWTYHQARQIYVVNHMIFVSGGGVPIEIHPDDVLLQ